MPKKSTTTTEPKNSELNLTVGSVSDIPKVVRAGRTSRYAPLYARVASLGKDEMISFPISKYSQVQAFRPRLEELGFSVSVRKSGNDLIAYVRHTPAEKSE